MKNTTAKVVRFNRIGDASVLNIEQLPVLHPRDNEVRIKVAAIGINRADVMFRNGAYLEAPQFPSKLGYEASGIIECVGSNVDTFKIGDRVSTIPAFSMGQHGVYGERVIVPVEAVEKCPRSFSMEQSAAIWMQYITAYGALIDIGQLQSGQTILITAASSSVGVAAIHLAKNLGAKVVATTRGDSKKPFLLSQGADHVIQTDTEDLVTAMATITNNSGAELIFDPIGGPILSQLAEVAATAGRIIEYGALDTAPTPYPLFIALAKGLIIQGYTIFETSKQKDKLSAAKAYLLPLFEDNKIVPVIDKVFSFDDIQDAHRYMESNQQKGKIIVSMN